MTYQASAKTSDSQYLPEQPLVLSLQPPAKEQGKHWAALAHGP